MPAAAGGELASFVPGKGRATRAHVPRVASQVSALCSIVLCRQLLIARVLCLTEAASSPEGFVSIRSEDKCLPSKEETRGRSPL